MESAEALPLDIYPNPSGSFFTIKWPGAGNATAQIINLQGKILLEKSLIEGYGIVTPQENLPSGLYLIKVTSHNGAGTKVRKVIWQ